MVNPVSGPASSTDAFQLANLSFWTWGESELAKQIPTKDFVDNDFGAITTAIPAQGG